MHYSINNFSTLEQFKEFLKENSSLIIDEDDNFMRFLTKAWINKILSKKLIEFHEEELAQKIDAINPNQSRYEICEAIYTIILPPKQKTVSEEPFNYDIGESYTSGIEFGVLI